MKRWMPIFVGLVLILSLVVSGTAQAQTLIADSSSKAAIEQAVSQEKLITQLKDQLLPQIESILTPEQREQLEAAVAKKTSLRKAFKSIMLTPEQKTKLAGVLKSLPKKDFFASMTPEQKKQFFTRKKEVFTPTAEDIAEYKSKQAK